MKSRLLCALIAAVLCPLLSATTTVTGTVKTLGGTSANNSFVRFWLRGCNGNQPRVNGVAIVPSNTNGQFYFDFPTNSVGAVSGSLYSTRDAAGTGGGEIDCGGSHTAAWYGMQVFRNSVGGPETPVQAKNTGTLDVSNVTPTSTNPVVVAPTGDSTYARLDSGNQPFSGGIQALSVNTVVNASSYANFGAAVAACPVSGTIQVTQSVSVTANVTVPSTCLVSVVQGGVLNVSISQTLTFSGSNLAAGPYTIFAGSGTVTGLSTVMPEWFGAASITSSIQGAFGASGGTLILQPNTTYSSSYNFGWTLSNVWFKGGGNPTANGTNTALSGGTIITKGLSFCSANNVRITDLGFDNGSTFNGGPSTNDALSISGNSQCQGSPNSGEALVTGTYINNVSCMLSSGAVAFHCMRIEHNNAPSINNVTLYFGAHGLAVKSNNAVVNRVMAYGQGTDAVIVKADDYTATNHVLINNIEASTLTSANLLQNCLVLDAEQAAQLNDVLITNLQCANPQFGITITSTGTFGAAALNNITLSNVTYVLNNAGLGISGPICLESTGTATNTITNFHSNNLTCINQLATAFQPMSMALPMNGGVFENTVIAKSNSNGSVVAGNSVSFKHYTELNSTASKPFNLSTNAVVYVDGYNSAVNVNTSSIGSGAALNLVTRMGTNMGFGVSDGIYYGAKIMTVSSLSSATAIPNTVANTGILVVRDNTSGGTATFVIDPNSGATTIAGTVTGLASTGVTFGSGHWSLTLTSGTVPRSLAITVYD